MAGYLPPGFPFIPPPPPPRSTWSPPPPPPWHWKPSPEPSDNNAGGVIAGIAISVGAFLLVLSFVCSLCQGDRNSRANAAADAARAAAALAARPQAPLRPELWDNEEQSLRRHHSDHDAGHTRRASPTADLPSFTYNRAVRHNVTGSGEEVTTCSVCLGPFQVGQRVRLLPVFLHLYHVECIDPWLEAHSTCPLCRNAELKKVLYECSDPWLEAHSTCPLCRSGTDDPMIHDGQIPPV